jgi:hypothetical protein
MSNDAELHDVSREAQSAGIPLPVSVDRLMMETLTPGPYLESLGITREQRIMNLLRLTRVMVNLEDESARTEDARIPVPFMLLRGPLVREDCLTVTIRIKRDADGKKAIVISRMPESNE